MYLTILINGSYFIYDCYWTYYYLMARQLLFLLRPFVPKRAISELFSDGKITNLLKNQRREFLQIRRELKHYFTIWLSNMAYFDSIPLNL